MLLLLLAVTVLEWIMRWSHCPKLAKIVSAQSEPKTFQRSKYLSVFAVFMGVKRWTTVAVSHYNSGDDDAQWSLRCCFFFSDGRDGTARGLQDRYQGMGGEGQGYHPRRAVYLLLCWRGDLKEDVAFGRGLGF